MAYIGNNPKYNTSTYTPQSADPTNAAEGMVFRSDGTTRAEGLWEYKNSNWVSVGTGEGVKNFYEQGIADSAQTSDFSTGNNATFDGGGSFNGTFSKSTTAADLIGGISVFKWVGHATAGNNDDDYIASSAIDIPLGYRGRQLAVKLQYKWDGTDDYMKWVVKDETNTAIITTGSELIKQHDSNDTATTFTLSFFCPADCTQVKIGPQCITGEVSKTFIWDEIIVTPDAFVDKNLLDKQSIIYDAHAGYGSSATKIPYFTNARENSGDNILTVANDSTNGFTLTAQRECLVTINYDVDFSSAAENFGFSVDGSPTTNISSLTYATGSRGWKESAVAGQADSYSISIKLNAGEVLRPHTEADTVGTAANCRITIVAEAESEHIIAYNEFAKNVTVKAVNNGGGAITANVTNIDWTEVTDNFNAWNGTQFTVPVDGVYDMSGAIQFTTGANRNIFLYIDAVESGSVARITNDPQGNFALQREFTKGQVVSFRCGTNSTLSAGTSYNWLNIVRIGASQLLGVPTQPVALRYDTDAGQSIDNASEEVVNFDSTTFGYDTHGIVTTGAAWKATANIAGYWQIAAGILFDDKAFDAGEKAALYLYKNGTKIARLDSWEAHAGVTTDVHLGGSTTLYLEKGDYIDVRAYQNSGGALTLSAAEEDNYIAINKLGFDT